MGEISLVACMFTSSLFKKQVSIGSRVRFLFFCSFWFLSFFETVRVMEEDRFPSKKKNHVAVY